MRFYFADGQLWPTQATAKAAAIEAEPRRGNRKFWPVDVPTDKQGLLEYLNEQLAETAEPAAIQIGELSAEDRAKVEALLQASPGAKIVPLEEPVTLGDKPIDQLEAFIQDQATPAEVERIFTSLGVRFHEMRKAAER